MKALLYILAVCGLLVAAGCGGGGGGSSPAEPQVAQPPSPQPPPPPPPNCVETADFGCVFPDKYREERETIELDHSGEEDFKNQWGLTAVRAGWA